MSCRYENVWGFDYPQSHLSVSVDIHYQGGTFLSSIEHPSLAKESPDQEARESNEVGLQLRLNSGSESAEKIPMHVTARAQVLRRKVDLSQVQTSADMAKKQGHSRQ